MTKASLLAKAITQPVLTAAITGFRPAAPTIAPTTTSAAPSPATSSTPCAPAKTSAYKPESFNLLDSS